MMESHIRFVLLPTLALLLVGAVGCTDQQLSQADQVATSASAVAQAPAQIAAGPAGLLIPPGVRSLLELLGFAATTGLAVWKWLLASGLLKKNQSLTTAFKAVVDGVTSAGEAAGPVKAEIKRIMQTREIYAQANATVDSVKSGPSKNP